MNIETMKLLTDKEKENEIIRGELEEMKEQLKKCLLVQDNLFEKHYEIKSKLTEQIKVTENQLYDKTCDVQKLNEELGEYRNMNLIYQNNDKDKMK